MAIDAKMKAKLSKFNKNFSKERKRADELGGFSEIPDGKFLSKLIACEIKNSNAEEMHLVFQFEILESAEDESLVGAKCSKWCNVEKKDGPAYLIRDLRKFGIELEDLEQLPEIAKILDDQKPELKLTLKTGNSGQFTYIDSVITEIDAGDHAADEDGGDGDEDDEDEGDDEGDGEDSDEGDDESDSSDEDGEDDDEDVQLEVGTKVSFTTKKGEEVSGEIVSINEEDSVVDVKSGTRSFKGIALDRLSIPEADETDDEEEEEEEAKPAPKRKETKTVAKKKAAPKTAAKKTSRKK